MASIDIAVRCSDCGKELDCSEDYGRSEFVLEVDPCSKCLEDAIQDSFDEGKEEGLTEGREEKEKE